MKSNKKLNQEQKLALKLCEAICMEDVATVKKLAESGVSLEIPMTNRSEIVFRLKTPLFVAIELANPDLVDVLVNHGADVNALDTFGASPLDWAMAMYFGYSINNLTSYRRGSPRIIQALVESGANFSTYELKNDGRLVFAGSGNELFGEVV